MTRRASQTHRKLPIERSKPTGDIGRVDLHLGPPARFYGRHDWPEMEAQSRDAWERNRELVMAQARASGTPDDRPWAYFWFDRPHAETIPGPLRDRLLAEGRLTAHEAEYMAWCHGVSARRNRTTTEEETP